MQTTNIKNIDNKHTEWKKDLGFYQDEIAVFTKRLTEVAAKNTGKEVMQMVEHFQNQLVIQSEQIEILLHDINQHIHLIAADVTSQGGHVNNDKISAHFTLLDRFENTRAIFSKLKADFMNFLVKVM